MRGATAGLKLGCEMLAGAVAVANFYGFLLRRLTLTTASPLMSRGSQGGKRFPGISAKLVRSCEITANLHRCKKFLEKIENFCQEGKYGGNDRREVMMEVVIMTAEDVLRTEHIKCQSWRSSRKHKQ